MKCPKCYKRVKISSKVDYDCGHSSHPNPLCVGEETETFEFCSKCDPEQRNPPPTLPTDRKSVV